MFVAPFRCNKLVEKPALKTFTFTILDRQTKQWLSKLTYKGGK